MSRDFRLKPCFALSKLVFIPFLFLLICFTYLSSLVFKLSKSFQKSVHTFFTKPLFKSIGWFEGLWIQISIDILKISIEILLMPFYFSIPDVFNLRFH